MKKHPATPERRTLLGLAHKAAQLAGLGDDCRRAVQLAVTGCDSCAAMSDAQLRRLLWHYKKKGIDIGVPGPSRPGGQGLERPTKQQWARLDKASAAMGWSDGLQDRRLAGFVEHTTGLGAVRFLTRAGCTQVIAGLERWARQRQSNEATKEEE